MGYHKVPGKYSFQLTSSLTKKPSVQFHVNVNHVDALKLIGARVKRGPDWCYGNHDGGDGKLGTVESRSNVPTGFDCSVKWDITKSHFYRWGTNGKYELELVS